MSRTDSLFLFHGLRTVSPIGLSRSPPPIATSQIGTRIVQIRGAARNASALTAELIVVNLLEA